MHPTNRKLFAIIFAGRLESDRVARGSLISDDERVLAINILLERGQESRHGKILEEIRERISKTSAILSGVPVFRIVASEKTSSEILRFVPITAALIAIMIGVLFRSILAVCLSLLPGLLASWFVLGIMGYTGAPLSITTMVLPSIILALGCAYAMHPLVVVGEIEERDASGRFALDRLEEAMLSVALPIALSGLTTTVGFLSMSLLRIEAVHATGLYGAIGVLAVSLLTLTLLPAALRISKSNLVRTRSFQTAESHRRLVASPGRGQTNGDAGDLGGFVFPRLLWSVADRDRDRCHPVATPRSRGQRQLRANTRVPLWHQPNERRHHGTHGQKYS